MNKRLLPEDLRMIDSPRQTRIGIGKWGNWKLQRHSGELLHVKRMYRVDLDRMKDAAAVLDWICQVSQKRWATEADVYFLVQAVNDLVQPQASLCSMAMVHGSAPASGTGKE